MAAIDFHSHYFSRIFFDTLAAQSTQPGDVAERLARVVERTGLELPGDDEDAHRERWLGLLAAHDLEHMVTFASVPQEAPAVLRAAAAASGRLSAMVLVDLHAEGAASKVSAMLDGGASGVLTFPAMHHYHVGDEAARPALEVLNAARAVCYVHCGLLVVKLRDLLGLPRPQDLSFANPLSIIPAANAHPELTFVIPHFGAGFFRETLMAGAQCSNVYVDTSSSNSWITTQPGAPSLRDVFARALDVFGPERILFGTDSGTFPAGWRADRLSEQRDLLDDLRCSAAEQDLVFRENARRVLRLPAV